MTTHTPPINRPGALTADTSGIDWSYRPDRPPMVDQPFHWSELATATTSTTATGHVPTRPPTEADLDRLLEQGGTAQFGNLTTTVTRAEFDPELIVRILTRPQALAVIATVIVVAFLSAALQSPDPSMSVLATVTGFVS